MELNNSNDNNGGDGQQQLRRSAQIRKFNESSNDEDKPAAAREKDQPEPEDCSSSKKNRYEANDLDLETKRVRNPHGNRWNATNTRATIAADGLNISNNTNGYKNVFAVQPFLISGQPRRMDEFPGTICYYYELKIKSHRNRCYLGLSDGAIPVKDDDNDNIWLGRYPNSYAIPVTGLNYYGCHLAGERHFFELPEGTIIKPRRKRNGMDVYGCGLVLDPESKRMRNPSGNRWLGRNRMNFIISEDGLSINPSNTRRAHNVTAEKGFRISGEYSRMDNFPGTMLYYYEVSVLSFHDGVWVGLYGRTRNDDRTPFGWHENSYAIQTGNQTATTCFLAGEPHRFELPEGAARRPEMKGFFNVVGCGLIVDPDNKVTIFFTLNGKHLGKPIPINPSVSRLFPTVRMQEWYAEANFGDDPAKPFEYDVINLSGLGLGCI